MSSPEWQKFLERAKQRAKIAARPRVWSPQEVGDFLYGEVIDIVQNPWDESVTSYVVRNPDTGEEFLTPRHSQLVSELKRKQPQIGYRIYIRYDGTGKAKPGRSAPKLFAVYVEPPQGPLTTYAQPQPAEPAPPAPPPVVTAGELAREEAEEEKPTGLESIDKEKLRRYLQTLSTIYTMPLSWKSFVKQLEAKGFFMPQSDAMKLPEMFPDILEVTEDGKKVRFKK
jgi:hypothetical protein